MKDIQFTRGDYLTGRCTHDEYYRQFVTEEIKNVILQFYSKEQLKNVFESDKHFNSIRLLFWDALPFPVNVRKLRAAGDVLNNAGKVCIGKCAARMIISEN